MIKENRTLRLSPNGREHLIASEGLHLNAYLDTEGVPTIGVGNTYYADGTRVKMGDKLKNTQEAYNLFDTVTDRDFGSVVREVLKVRVTQNQFDALVSFVYNVGAEAFKKSTLLKVINGDKPGYVSEQFIRWCKTFKSDTQEWLVHRGLLNRRLREIKLYYS